MRKKCFKENTVLLFTKDKQLHIAIIVLQKI